MRPKVCYSKSKNMISHKIENENEKASGISTRSESSIQSSKPITDNLCSKSLIHVEYQAKSPKKSLENNILNTKSQIFIKDFKSKFHLYSFQFNLF